MCDTVLETGGRDTTHMGSWHPGVADTANDPELMCIFDLTVNLLQ